jgi:hypothetical protein
MTKWIGSISGIPCSSWMSILYIMRLWWDLFWFFCVHFRDFFREIIWFYFLPILLEIGRTSSVLDTDTLLLWYRNWQDFNCLNMSISTNICTHLSGPETHQKQTGLKYCTEIFLVVKQKPNIAVCEKDLQQYSARIQ